MTHPICTVLQETIKNIVENEWGGNIRKAAKHLDADYHLTYRLYHGQQKSLDFFAALRLVKATGISPDGSLLRELYPCEFEDLGPLTQDVLALETLVAGLEFAVSSPFRYEVLLYASEIPGVTRELLEREFGRRGLIAFEELAERSLLREAESGEIVSSYSDAHWGPESICIKIAQANLSLVNLSRPGSFLRNHAVALNADGLREYYRLHRGFVEQLAELERDDKYRGLELAVSGLFVSPISTRSRSEGRNHDH